MKTAAENLEKVRKTAVLSILWAYIRKLEPSVREDDHASFNRRLKTMNLEGKQDHNSQLIKDEHGSLLRDAELIRERWVQWFHTLLNTKSPKLDRTECGNYRGISLVAHAGKILLKIVARHLSDYCERLGILPEKQSGFQPNRSTTDMMFVIRRLQELARKKRISLYVCFIDLTIAYDSLHRTRLWTVLARFGVPRWIISIICQFHGDMQACVRLDDGMFLG